MTTGFALHPSIDPAAAAARYAASGRAQLRPFLADADAARLHAHLRASGDWRLVINQGPKLFELDRAQQAALTPERQAALDAAVWAAARQGFQFRYETIRVPDEDASRRARATMLDDFARFLSSERVVSLLRKVTGDDSIAFADAQGTAYGPGHFLTRHDDDVAGKRRRAAYVVNLCPTWQIEWGGLLLFHGTSGDVEEVFVPTFNAINLFRVPQPHSVSVVTPIAPARRYAVTGWLRTGSQP